MSEATVCWTKIEGAEALPEGVPTAVKAGSKRIAVVNTGKGFYGMDLACPHMKAPMTNGILMGAGTMVRCPKHNFIFRLKDGKGVNCLGLNMKTYEVREQDGALEVLLQGGS
jgi:nitrite reductase/ring-hydroxylating ferredoxin subunit